jgi:hypothetical protein
MLTQMTYPPTTALTNGTTISNGWYMDFNINGTTGWRLTNNDPTAPNGVVSFFAELPVGDNACSGNIQTQDFAIDYGIGVSVLLNPAGTAIVGSIASGTTTSTGNTTPATIGMHWIVCANGQMCLEVDKADGTTLIDPTKQGAAIRTQLLNWRETPAVD